MAKKSKKKIRVKRYVTVTKTVTKQGKDYTEKAPSGTSAIIGEYAGLIFEVNVKEDGGFSILTFSDAVQEVSANWEEHVIIGRKFPKPEFVGANARTFSMKITIDSQFGQSPHAVLYKLHKFCEEGGISELHIGSRKIGNKWYIQSISETWDQIYKKGQLTRATVELTLAYYG